MKREEAIAKLDAAKAIYMTITDFGYSRAYGAEFPYFLIWVMSERPPTLEAIVAEDVGYWSARKFAYGVAVWGMDRIFELLHSIGGTDKANEWMKKLQRLWV